MHVTAERLGLDPHTHCPVWVFWTDASLLDTLLAAESVGCACPECGRGLELRRARGLIECVSETPAAVSVSDRCRSCQAQLHFDATPEARRANLRWPQVAVGKGLLVPPALVTSADVASLAVFRKKAGLPSWP